MKKVMISLGGSIIVPEKINVKFLKDFRKIILSFAKKGYRFALYCGGGSIARNYQDAAKSIAKAKNADLDWIGTVATRLNAELVRTLFSDYAHKRVIYDPTERIVWKQKILVAGGWKPGWSTDYDSVILAKNLGIREVINMTNVDYVYDSDPRKNKNAKPLKRLSWKEFRKIVGEKWVPGINAPFDPVAAKEAQKSKLKVIILNENLKNLKRLFDGKPFIGTIIEP